MELYGGVVAVLWRCCGGVVVCCVHANACVRSCGALQLRQSVKTVVVRQELLHGCLDRQRQLSALTRPQP